MKKLFKRNMSKIYFAYLILLLVVVFAIYTSYAAFHFIKEKNAINLITGDFDYLLSDDHFVIPARDSQIVTITISSKNTVDSIYQLYYVNNDNLDLYYVDNNDLPFGNMDASGRKTISLVVVNKSSESQTVSLGVQGGLTGKTLTLENGRTAIYLKYVFTPAKEVILASNSLQKQPSNMFNYSSNGDYYNLSKQAYFVDSAHVSNGLYSMNDDDGASYFFRGDIDSNNVIFGAYENDYYIYVYNDRYFQSLSSCQSYNSNCNDSKKVKLASAGDKMYWKIIRVNGDNSLRLLYNGTHPELDYNKTDLSTWVHIGMSPYHTLTDDPKYAGYTYVTSDKTYDSTVKEMVDQWYMSTLGNSLFDEQIAMGRFCSDGSGYKLCTDYGFSLANTKVFAAFNRLVLSQYHISKKTVLPTLTCPADLPYGGNYRLKAGLITADELVLGGQLFGTNTSTYLNMRSDPYWTMTPSHYKDIAYAAREYGGLTWNTISTLRAVRPVINVIGDKGFKPLGDGSVSNPYVMW